MGTTRRQCARVGLPFTKETAYGNQVPDAKLNKLFMPVDPIVYEVAETSEDDSDDIKGHEFPTGATKDIITAQDLTIPINFYGSTSLLGMLLTYALGADTVTGNSDPYTHNITPLDQCSNDQLPSFSAYLGFTNIATSILAAKGLVVNELKITMDGTGRLKVTGTVIGDGNLTANNAYTFPTSDNGTDVLQGTQADFLTANYGNNTVSKKSKLMSLEFTINNGIDTADGRAFPAVATKYLSSARLGKRTFSLTVKVEGEQGDEFWTDWMAKTEKAVQISFTKSANRSLTLDFPRTRITSCKQSFTGLRNTNEITYKLYWDTASSKIVTATVKDGANTYVAQ